MPEINEVCKNQMDEIRDFAQFIEDYGHIYHGDGSDLKTHFKQIIDGMDAIKQIVVDTYET